MLALCVPHALPAAPEAFPPIPELILGVNEGSQELNVNDEDLARLKAIGVNTVRFTVYPKLIGVPESTFAWSATDYAFNPEEAGSEIDWRPLDAFLERLTKHELTPYVCPPSPSGAMADHLSSRRCRPSALVHASDR